MPAHPPLILLLDDDLDFLEMNRRVLEAEGYRVAAFADPSDAFAHMERERPALVVTDLMMRALDTGFAFARRIKDDARFRGVPVLIVTAVGSRLGYDFAPAGAGDLAAMRADGYFEKPVTPDALLAKVAELVRQGRDEGQPS